MLCLNPEKKTSKSGMGNRPLGRTDSAGKDATAQEDQAGAPKKILLLKHPYIPHYYHQFSHQLNETLNCQNCACIIAFIPLPFSGSRPVGQTRENFSASGPHSL